MKILSREQVYQADKTTIENQQISSADLMERAGTGVFNWLHSRLQGDPVKIHVFCGIGNNGGDGMVIARHLITHGYNVEVYVVNFSDKRSEDFLLNLSRLKELKYWPKLIKSENEFPEITSEEIVIDAIFGIGLNRAPLDWVNALIKKINLSNAYTLSIDIPSGLYTDKLPESPQHIIKANYTLSFQSPKLPFFLPQTAVFSNDWGVIDIGIDQNFMHQVDTAAYFLIKEDLQPLYIPREKFSHKGTYGHSLIVGGSYGKIGAVQLSTRACLKTGAGLVTAYLPKCGYTSMQTAVPECMVITDEDEKKITSVSYEIEPTVIGVGIGIGTSKETASALREMFKKQKNPMVIDADAINILTKNKDMFNHIPPQSVLTPHPKELERLIGSWNDDFDKITKTKEFCNKYDCIVVIKGAHTITTYKNKIYINSTGNPGMATAGSGDVLTGIITGLISQGYTPLNASIFGVYIHGKAGDLAADELVFESIIASDIIDKISDAYIDLFKIEKIEDKVKNEEEEE